MIDSRGWVVEVVGMVVATMERVMGQEMGKVMVGVALVAIRAI